MLPRVGWRDFEPARPRAHPTTPQDRAARQSCLIAYGRAAVCQPTTVEDAGAFNHNRARMRPRSIASQQYFSILTIRLPSITRIFDEVLL
jgi:hypothetical protein